MKAFIDSHQIKSDPFAISAYARSMFGGPWKGVKPWDVHSITMSTDGGLKSILGVYSKENTVRVFTFSKIIPNGRNEDVYAIDYDLFGDKIQAMTKNYKTITDPTEREAICQSIVDEIKMPADNDVKKAKEYQVKDKINKDIKRENSWVVFVGIGLTILMATLGLVFLGPWVLIGVPIPLLMILILGKHSGLFDTKAERADRVEAIFKDEQEKARRLANPSFSLPPTATATESVSQVSASGKVNPSDSPSAPLDSSSNDKSASSPRSK